MSGWRLRGAVDVTTVVHQVLSGAGPVDAVTRAGAGLPASVRGRGAGAATTSPAHIDPRIAARVAAAASSSRPAPATTAADPLLGLRAAAARRARRAAAQGAAVPQRHAGALVLGPRADDRGAVRARAPAAAGRSPRACDVVAGVSAVQRRRAGLRARACRDPAVDPTRWAAGRREPAGAADAAVRRPAGAAQAPGRADPRCSRCCAATGCPTRGSCWSASRCTPRYSTRAARPGRGARARAP